MHFIDVALSEIADIEKSAIFGFPYSFHTKNSIDFNKPAFISDEVKFILPRTSAFLFATVEYWMLYCIVRIPVMLEIFADLILKNNRITVNNFIL